MAASGGSDRAVFSSALALLGAVTLSAFTTASMASVSSLHWSMWLVVGWSYAMALALVVWSVRDWSGIHWIGNPTLSMVASASGTSLAAVALAFALASAKDQDARVAAQNQLLEAQLRVLERIEHALIERQLADQASKSTTGMPESPTASPTNQ